MVLHKELPCTITLVTMIKFYPAFLDPNYIIYHFCTPYVVFQIEKMLIFFLFV